MLFVNASVCMEIMENHGKWKKKSKPGKIMENENLAKSHGILDFYKCLSYFFWEKCFDCLHTMTPIAVKYFTCNKWEACDTRFCFWSDRCNGGVSTFLNAHFYIRLQSHRILKNGHGKSWKSHGISFPDLCGNPGMVYALSFSHFLIIGTFADLIYPR